MALESATYIHQLNQTNPTDGDPASQGDNHLRLIKAALKATFPNISGPITSTQGQLNSISGLTDTVNGLIAKIYPVGSIYITARNENPGTTLGVGVWERWGQGRALVGFGTADGTSWTTGQTRGSATQALTVGNLPSHTHTVSGRTLSGSTNTTGSHNHRIRESQGGDSTNEPYSGFAGSDYHAQWSARNSEPDGNHNHTVSVTMPSFATQSAGSGTAHNNIQPSIGVYVWRRTS